MAVLTRRGWALLTAAAAISASAALFGLQELYAISVAAAMLLVACAVWAKVRPWNLGTERMVRPLRVPAGGSARVELAVHNQASRPSPVVSARDPFDGGRRWASFLVAPLAPGERRRAAYRLPTAQRGVFALGPLELELSDPFGLVKTSRRGAPESTLTVHPRVQPIRALPVPAGAEDQAAAGTPVISSSGEEFYALREYRTGDDLRHVHWASTARLDELMIRQAETPWRGRLTVVVDLRAGLYTADGLEVALSAAASIIEGGLRTRVHVRLVTTAGADTGYGDSQQHRAVVLDELAASHEHRGGQLTALLRPLRAVSGEAVAAITSERATDTDLAGACRLTRPEELTLVVVDRGATTAPSAATGGGRVLPVLPCRVVRVSAGTTFAAAWDRQLAIRRPAQGVH